MENINNIKLYKSFEYLLDRYSRKLAAQKYSVETHTYNLRFHEFFNDRRQNKNKLADIVSVNLQKHSDLLYKDSELRGKILKEFIKPTVMTASIGDNIPNIDIRITGWDHPINYDDLFNIIKVILICYIKEEGISPTFNFSSSYRGLSNVVSEVVDELVQADPEIEAIVFEWRLK